jgi:DNA polymerase III epsilon subunit-like protein
MSKAEEVIYVVDVETSRTDEDAAICEIAAVPVTTKGKVLADKSISTLVNPMHPIAVDCQAVHHLSDKDVEGAPLISDVMAGEFKVLRGATIAAHNIAFDHKFLKPHLSGKERLICTYRTARHLYQDAPNLKNQTLRYYLNVDVPEKYLKGLAPHRALYDTLCTAYILGHYLSEHSTVSELIELTNKPVLLKTIGFGVHRGKSWAEVPPAYLGWILGKDFEDDVKFTAKHWLKQPPAK